MDLWPHRFDCHGAGRGFGSDVWVASIPVIWHGRKLSHIVAEDSTKLNPNARTVDKAVVVDRNVRYHAVAPRMAEFIHAFVILAQVPEHGARRQLQQTFYKNLLLLPFGLMQSQALIVCDKPYHEAACDVFVLFNSSKPIGHFLMLQLWHRRQQVSKQTPRLRRKRPVHLQHDGRRPEVFVGFGNTIIAHHTSRKIQVYFFALRFVAAIPQAKKKVRATANPQSANNLSLKPKILSQWQERVGFRPRIEAPR